MWHEGVWMGHPMRLELTRVGFLVQLTNYYTTEGANVQGLIITTTTWIPPKLFISLCKTPSLHSQSDTYMKPLKEPPSRPHL